MAMMTTEYDFGKDHVVLMSDEDATVEPQYQLPDRDPDDDEPTGLIQPNGDINWDCPCLGGMASGPCGTEFREAFSCFHYSKDEPKGMECLGAFQSMQTCLAKYPALYPMDDDKDDPISQALQESEAETAAAISAPQTSPETRNKN